MLWLTVLIAVLTDRLLGEPKRLHPLVGWAGYALLIERCCNGGQRWQGVMAWLLAVAVPAGLVAVSLHFLRNYAPPYVYHLAAAALLYLAIGWQSLREHGLAVAQALQQNIAAARAAVARIVSRNTETMDEPAVLRGVLESLLENGADAIFAALFWFVVAGPVGVVVYRLANTLDAMWGYRTARYQQFGWFSAKVDDVLNSIPARLTALSYMLLGKRRAAWRCWREQASQCASPNGGPVMCAGAGSLGVLLGGPTMYHGQWQEKPIMGCGAQPQAGDIARAIGLLDRTVYGWLIVLLVVVLSAELVGHYA
ncbi:adenosylcobinamide-phosphate synthase CbiB [Dasania marina]|uniref:adenosylcobinamide-phosphate synthase CbiB n=1 Tax=Dasania marina TaxID=471499 RepID=UPI00037CFDDF|nr:adenosylcobinamide-phosphate synthase CbiB [Dasania marina]